ncbi:transcription termination factor Rho [uncultured Streptomyces sp.]|uniref:transcription termination factor Rho n=1 Tax=uncultured Streptomyces sp. TaxID=174707 RepID=UPI002612AF21|nr:transcription termination factor Rho [uncultured Streptomyces sp.]
MTSTLVHPTTSRTAASRTTTPRGTASRTAASRTAASRTDRAPAVPAAGLLDLVAGGHGLLRDPDGRARPEDVRVSPALVRRHGLRKGDAVAGTAHGPRDLATVERINGREAGALDGRRHFRDLTPLHPRERLRLETPSGGPAMRVVDLIAPVGKGQRGLIVAPPRTGKTVLLQQLAAAVTANHPEAHLMVVLVDERPEEVTDMRRSVRGEVYSSTFDRPAKEHIALADLAVERAKRLVEQGEDVVILLDSLTRLCRAHNTAAGAGGRTLSGGVDAGALAGPKKLFGAARLAEEGGSLTILATALVDTGSRADDFFFEELKGTGNMELRLDRTLAEQRVFPAIGIAPSGTRRDELLVPADELAAVKGLRRALHGRDGQGALQALLDRIRTTPDNAAFVRLLRSTAPKA